MTPEEIAFQEFDKVGDEKLFPNFTDKDIWIDGFKDGYEKGLSHNPIKPKVFLNGLLEAGFKLIWDSNGKRCYHYKCSSRVSMFFVFDESNFIVRCGMTTNDGVIFPLNKDSDMADVIAAKNIFTVWGT